MRSTESPPARSTRAGRFADDSLSVGFLACALLYALSTLCAIVNFAWRQPTFDQYKEYGNYLSRPFLDSVTMIENGHRPVIPALIANIEILWFHASQLLQLSIGTSCVFLTFALIAWTLWRQEGMPRSARAAGVLLAALGLLWLGDARMLLQGVGQLQTYLVAFFVTIAALCTARTAQGDSWGWIAAATAACAAAMFTFGAGVAAFPTIIALSLLLRLRWRKVLLPSIAAMLCLGLYILVMPGHQGVRNSLSLHPGGTLVIVAKWLSSPWANGWLALADPPVQPWLLQTMDTSVGQLLMNSANWLVDRLGTPWRSIVAVLGGAGAIFFLARLAASCVQRRVIGRSEALANALCIFALASAVIVGIGRLDYLEAIPDQVFADRYLIWPCLFWTGLAWLVLIDVCRVGNRAVAAIAFAFLAALPIALYPTHRSWAGWGATVYQRSQQAAAALRSGVFDEGLFPSGDDASREDVLRSLKLLKQARLAMFAEPSWELVGSQWRGSVTSSEKYRLDLHLVDSFRDSESGLTAARIEGTFLPESARVIDDEQLALLDDEDRVVGLAEFSFIAPDAEALRIDLPAKRGFDGYIRDYHADRNYRLVLLQASASRALLLKRLDSPT